MGTSCIDIIIIHVKRPCLLVYVSIRYIRTSCTSHIVFVMLTHMYIFIMPRALLSYKKFVIMRALIEWKTQNGRREWKNRMEIYRMEEWNGNRMEMVEMVDCNGWAFWASVLEF